MPIIFESFVFAVKFDGINVGTLGEFVNEAIQHLHNTRRLLAGVVVHSHEFGLKKGWHWGTNFYNAKLSPLFFAIAKFHHR